MGIGKRFLSPGNNKAREESPPPGSYDIPSQFSHKPRGKAFSMGINREKYRKVFEKHMKANPIDNPGPGNYDTRNEWIRSSL